MPDAPNILLVEDDPTQRRLVASLLEAAGHRVHAAGTLADAFAALDALPALELALSDFKLPDGDGLALLDRVRETRPGAARVLMTAYGSIEHAVEAIRRGADDYLTKPFERQALLLVIDKALRTRALREENRKLSDAIEQRERLVDLVGATPAMQKLYRRIERLAPTDATVLVTGESGTGKELVARALHKLSRRAAAPFVAVNCAAIPEGLVEAEFFGAERGAYTGASAARPGLFEQAHGGTLFLDELGELPPALQPKLLRVLQEGRLTRVGGRGEIAVDVRVLAATNRDLRAEIEAGRFREDLYYRLAVVTLALPPLRERREDIPLLVPHLAQAAARRHRLPAQKFSAEVLAALMDRDWPGNVRELAHVVERLLLLGDDEEDADAAHLPPSSRADATTPDWRLPEAGIDFAAWERDLLRQALDLARGNRTRAARLLNLPYKAFLYRIEKHGLAQN